MFHLTKNQYDILQNWIKENPVGNAGTIGGALTYSFTPTSLGVIVIVENSLNDKKIDLTEYENW